VPGGSLEEQARRETEGCVEKRQVQARAVVAAALIAVPAGWLIPVALGPSVGVGNGFNPGFAALAVLSASLAAWVVSANMPQGRLWSIWEASKLAVLTYVVGIVLFPIGSAVVAWPGVSGGGQIPCYNIQIIGTANHCASGLHGAAALVALIGATVPAYGLLPLVLVVLTPLLALLLLPSLIWVLVMHLGRVYT
jgi:hypothetical protein